MTVPTERGAQWGTTLWCCSTRRREGATIYHILVYSLPCLAQAGVHHVVRVVITARCEVRLPRDEAVMAVTGVEAWRQCLLAPARGDMSPPVQPEAQGAPTECMPPATIQVDTRGCSSAPTPLLEHAADSTCMSFV